MWLATGEDGSADTKMLPPGEYTVKVKTYPFHRKSYCQVHEPVTSFIVESGTHMEETITIDARTIKPLVKYDRRELENCKP